MEDNILVSIIMPIYNSAEYVRRALDSIPEREDIEVICIDDCSTDNSMEILKSYDRIPITVLQTSENKGPGAARNLGYNVAKGEYVYGLDSDDWLETKAFNTLLNQLNKLNRYDILHVLIQTNYGTIWNKNCDCDAVHTYLLKRSFMGFTRMPEVRRSEDAEFLKTLRLRKPVEGLVQLVVSHYNFPREGSITWNYRHGKVDWFGNKK